MNHGAQWHFLNFLLLPHQQGWFSLLQQQSVSAMSSPFYPALPIFNVQPIISLLNQPKTIPRPFGFFHSLFFRVGVPDKKKIETKEKLY